MASKELSILLLAKDMASKTIGRVSKQVGGLGKMGATASRGLSNLAGNLAKLGAVAAVGLGVAVKSGLSSLAELESAVTSVDGAIKQMGMTGQVTGSQVATWANEIEAATGAAFDDKAITQATSTLIRFGKVTKGNIRPAMQIITDLATKTGDVESAATLLAKALADPEKAAGKLARSGVILTKAEQDQIKAFTKAGDAAAAQKVILDSLAKTTKDAALASQGPYKRAMSVLADVTEDAQRALAEGFLPVLEKVAGKLSTALADPKVMANIREFGRGLASGLDSLISIVEKLPWATIGSSLQLAGAGAKAVLGAFTSLPPWVQTAVLTGWGLNKLTGGALGSIVGQLASGLVKGVLGINAGVVNLKAATVIGGPGGGGAGDVVKGAGISAFLGTAAAAAAITAAATAAMYGLFVLIPSIANGGKTGKAPDISTNRNPARVVDATWQTIASNLGLTGKPVTGGGRGDKSTADEVKRLGAGMARMDGVIERAVAKGFAPTKTGIQATLDKNARAAVSGDDRMTARIGSLNAAVNSGTQASRETATAVRNIDFRPVVNVPVTVVSTVSVRGMTVAQSVRARYTRTAGDPVKGGAAKPT